MRTCHKVDASRSSQVPTKRLLKAQLLAWIMTSFLHSNTFVETRHTPVTLCSRGRVSRLFVFEFTILEHRHKITE